MIFFGCSDIQVTSHTATETLADSCHFNACRRAAVTTIVSNGSGDDACAFVTYYCNDDPTVIEGGDPGNDPYYQDGLGEWSNYGSIVGTIICNDNPASGLRLAGALNVQVGAVMAANSRQATIVDATVAGQSTFGAANHWTYLQSRDCVIRSIHATNCVYGFIGQARFPPMLPTLDSSSRTSRLYLL